MSATVSKVPPSATATISALETRFARTRMLIAALLGLLVGALLGGLAFAAMPADSTATAFLRLQNPVDLTAIAGGADQITPDNQDNTGTFVAGEIAYLSGEGFAQAVARKMAEDEPAELNIAQANESAMVTISVTSPTEGHAVRTVQAAIDLYTAELEQRIDEQLRTILPTVTQWQQTGTEDPLRMQDLQRLRESVELQAAEAATLMVVQPPTPNYPSSQRWLIGVMLGALVGGAGAAVFVLARQRRAGRGTVVDTLTDCVDGVLLPAVDLDLPPREHWGEDQLRLARTLYTQVPVSGSATTILVVGATGASGGAQVAELLEAAATETRPATASTGQHASPPDSTGARVVAGGAVGDPTLTPDAVAEATAILLVARIDTDTAAQVLALRSAAGSGDAPVLAVFTYRRRRWSELFKRDTR